MENPKPPNPGYQNWATPDDFFHWCEYYVLPFYDEYEFTLDACAEFENRKCPDWFCAPGYSGSELGLMGRDGLFQDWKTSGAVWCNPPYRQCTEWTGKAVRQAILHDQLSVVLTHAAHGAKWHRYAYQNCVALWQINPRINFVPPPGVKPSSNPKDSYLWIFGPERLKCKGDPRIIYPPAWREDSDGLLVA